MPDNIQTHSSQLVPLDWCKPHPRNFRDHPQDQLDHIKKSIQEHGFYRNVVTAADGTILAGHGVVEASKQLKLESVPVVVVDIDPNSTQAIKLLVGDNMIDHLAVDNDRELAEMLREVHTIDELLGTGFDDKMLANFAMVTRDRDEIKDVNHAEEWAGMPSYDEGERPPKLVISFKDEAAREEFCESNNLYASRREGVWSAEYPRVKDGRDDTSSLILEDTTAEEDFGA